MTTSLFLDVFAVGPIQANCVLLGDTDAGEVVVIDPGEEAERIVERLKASGLRPTMILHTHGHLDHVGGTADLSRLLGGNLPIGLHPDEIELYRNAPMQARMFGLEVDAPPEARSAACGTVRQCRSGAWSSKCATRPAIHRVACVLSFSGTEEPLAIAGDVLFAGSIGRTDLPGGSFQVLDTSIREQLYTLPDETRVICGHGPDTTIGRERASNPYVSG